MTIVGGSGEAVIRRSLSHNSGRRIAASSDPLRLSDRYRRRSVPMRPLPQFVRGGAIL